MKNILLVIAFVVALTACNNNTKTDTPAVVEDTTATTPPVEEDYYIAFVDKPEDLVGRELFTAADIATAEAQDQLGKLYVDLIFREAGVVPGLIDSNKVAGKGYKYAAILLDGKVAFVTIPDGDFDTSTPYLADVNSLGCNCDGEKSGLQFKKGVPYCEDINCVSNRIKLQVKEGEQWVERTLVIEQGKVKEVVQ